MGGLSGPCSPSAVVRWPMADDLAHDAERIVLGSMLLDPAVIEPVRERLRATGFRDTRHGSIFAAICSAHAAGAETGPVGVAIALNAVKELQRVGGALYLHELTTAVPTSANAVWYAEKVAEAARVRAVVVDAIRLGQVAETGDIARIAEVKARLVEAWTRTAAEDPSGLPPAMTLRERLALPREPLVYRVDAWQPVGSRVMLSAQFKAGKTTLTGNLVRCLVDGDAFLGQYKVDPIPGTLALLDFEMSAHQLDDWLSQQGIVHDDRVVVLPLRGAATSFNILDAAVRTRWSRLLRSHGCGYVIFDCLRPVLDALGLDEHKQAGVLLTAFDALLREAQVDEATVVHHMGHSNERSRGDSRLRDWPDVEWRLVRQDDDPGSLRFLSAYGRDVEVRETQLAFDPASRRLTVGGGSRRETKVREVLPEVLHLLLDESGLSGRQIEEKVAEHPRGLVREAVVEGVRQGLIKTESGPRRSVLHSHFSPQCASAPQCAASAPAHSCECASALMYRRTGAHTPRGSSAPTETEPRCRVCGESLDPVLAADGVHPLCGVTP